MKQGVATTNKKPRKTRTRSTRGKSECFGIRYLHHHMFTADTPNDKQHCPCECKCGSTMASAYSSKTLVAMTASILILLIGVTFMLVGYLIPRRPVVFLEQADGTRIPVDHSAISFNTMLDDFTLIGTVLVSLGALAFCLILVIPICLTSRNSRGEYSQAPTEETQAETDRVRPVADNSHTGSSGATTVRKIPVLALVHGGSEAQAAEYKRSTSAGSRRDTKSHRSKLGKSKDSIEEEK